MITLSKDGYVRLTFAALQSTPIVHLLSGLDEENLGSGESQIDARGIWGFTEWISSTRPVITIGWDWRLDVTQGRPCYVRASRPRSNLMFLDSEWRDLGFVRTVAMLEVAVDAMEWQPTTRQAISVRYDAATCKS